MDCPPCKGSGNAWGILPIRCPLCIGRATISDERIGQPECRRCKGTGRENAILDRLCTTCGGWGLLPPFSQQVEDKDNLSVVYCISKTPYTSHLKLEEVLASLTGQVLVCDPFFGATTLELLAAISRSNQAKFLTGPGGHKTAMKIDGKLRAFHNEFGHVDFRATTDEIIHDRYILTDSEFILIGHGLKDIGRKDSFLVRIESNLMSDSVQMIRARFEELWKTAQPVIAASNK